MNRRTMLAAAAIALAVNFGVGAPVVQAQEGSVVVGVVGGTYGATLRGIIDDFAAKNGFKVEYVEGGSGDLLARARAEKNNPQMDLFIASDQTFVLAKSLGLLAKLDPQLVPNLQYVSKEFLDPDGYGQGYEVNVVGFAYNAEKFSQAGLQPPSSWMDFAKPELKGRTLIFTPTIVLGQHLLVGLAHANGKDEKDISSAWPVLDQIIANGAVVATSLGQAENMLNSGESWMYVSTANRAHLLGTSAQQIKFTLPKEGAIGYAVYLAPTANSSHGKQAQQILNHFLGAEVQQKLVEYSAIMPVNSEVKLTDEMRKRLGFDAGVEPKVRTLDVAVVNEALNGWLDRFNRAVSR